MRSIIQQNDNACYMCGRYAPLEEHHIYGGCNRKASERYGLKVRICRDCHNKVHFSNGKLMAKLRAQGQRIAMAHYGWSIDDFRKHFGQNYLEVEE